LSKDTVRIQCPDAAQAAHMTQTGRGRRMRLPLRPFPMMAEEQRDRPNALLRPQCGMRHEGNRYLGRAASVGHTAIHAFVPSGRARKKDAEWHDNDLRMLREVVPDLAQRVVDGKIDIAHDRKEVTSANRPSGSYLRPLSSAPPR
jgi:hypothetical protein